jgi:hypothetical protein
MLSKHGRPVLLPPVRRTLAWFRRNLPGLASGMREDDRTATGPVRGAAEIGQDAHLKRADQ